MNILIWGVNPNAGGGLAKITRLINTLLIKMKFNPQILAYDGQSEGYKLGFQNVVFFKADQQEFIYTELTKKKPDLIISIGDLWNCEFIANLIQKIAIPWITYVGSEGDSYPHRIFVKGNEALSIDKIVEMSSVIWAYTSHSEKVFRKEFPDKEIEILPHAIDITGIRKAEMFPLRKILNIDPRKKLIGFIGDNVTRKGIDLFIKLIAEREDFVGYIHSPTNRIQVGFDLEELRSLYDLKGRLYLMDDLRMKYSKQLLDSDIYGMYKTFDLFFHPHRAEGFGLCVMEALAAKIPVLATDCSGPSTYLPDNCKIHRTIQRYQQSGVTGYFVNDPIINTDLRIEDHEHNFNTSKYDYPEFEKNFKRLLEKKYEPIITWRMI
jgi:glycosyltransferase involved in cell wall biosynthesis